MRSPVYCKTVRRLRDSGYHRRRSKLTRPWRVVAALWYGRAEESLSAATGARPGDPCFALTSPEAGSDAGAIPDTGVVCMGEWQGQQVLGMRLTWNKRYITLAPIATVLGLAFKLSDPDRLLGGEEELGITCALIPTSTPGGNWSSSLPA